MQLSELLGLPVHDGRSRLGTVVDVRLAVPGDLDERPGKPTIFGLVISPRTRSSYLGYERTDARAPAALAALLRWRHRGTFLAAWTDVHRVGAKSVTLRDGFTRYSPLLNPQG
jgi:hypothetical protein